MPPDEGRRWRQVMDGIDNVRNFVKIDKVRNFVNAVLEDRANLLATKKAQQWLWLLTSIVTVIWTVAAILLFFKLLLAPTQNGDDINKVGLILAALLGAPFVVWRTKVEADQARIAQERMVTDRFSKAVDQLGAVRRVPRIHSGSGTDVRSNWEEEQPTIEVRLGGLYTLQRLMDDSLSDHFRIAKTLCSYIRINSTRQVDDDTSTRQPDVDIQTAMNILGERSYERCLREFNNLVSLRLTDSVLRNSNLNGLRFPFVDFEKSNLSGAKLRHTDLRQAWLEWTKLQFADFHGCILDRSALRGADLSDTNITQEMIDSAHGVKSGFGRTQLPAGRNLELPIHWFDASDAEKDSGELRDAYLKDYNEFLDRTKGAWKPVFGRQMTIEDILLSDFWSF
jgi:hypothetical protein